MYKIIISYILFVYLLFLNIICYHFKTVLGIIIKTFQMENV